MTTAAFLAAQEPGTRVEVSNAELAEMLNTTEEEIERGFERSRQAEEKRLRKQARRAKEFHR